MGLRPYSIRVSGNMQINAGAVKPQIHPTSIPLKVLQGEWVTLSINLPDYDVGEVLFVRLYVDGKLYLYPCANSGSGYEIIEDVQEGVHFEFLV